MLQEMAEEVGFVAPSPTKFASLTKVLRVASQAAERRRLLQQQNTEREKHKQERLKLIYQIEALMRQVGADTRVP